MSVSHSFFAFDITLIDQIQDIPTCPRTILKIKASVEMSIELKNVKVMVSCYLLL